MRVECEYCYASISEKDAIEVEDNESGEVYYLCDLCFYEAETFDQEDFTISAYITLEEI